jgi:hypothetical protein
MKESGCVWRSDVIRVPLNYTNTAYCRIQTKAFLSGTLSRIHRGGMNNGNQPASMTTLHLLQSTAQDPNCGRCMACCLSNRRRNTNPSCDDVLKSSMSGTRLPSTRHSFSSGGWFQNVDMFKPIRHETHEDSHPN